VEIAFVLAAVVIFILIAHPSVAGVLVLTGCVLVVLAAVEILARVMPPAPQT
jgi:hypothetical protein